MSNIGLNSGCTEQVGIQKYSVGMCVVYRSEGLCDIVDIRKEKFAGGSEAEYYILSPRNDSNSIVCVPVDNERLTGYIRRLLSAEEIRALIAEVKPLRFEWIPESRARNTYFKEILSVGDRRQLIVLLNTVREQIKIKEASGKKPGTTDTGAVYRASKLLREEFSPAIPLKNDAELFDLIDE